jgi:hypothetical protein
LENTAIPASTSSFSKLRATPEGRAENTKRAPDYLMMATVVLTIGKECNLAGGLREIGMVGKKRNEVLTDGTGRSTDSYR